MDLSPGHWAFIAIIVLSLIVFLAAWVASRGNITLEDSKEKGEAYLRGEGKNSNSGSNAPNLLDMSRGDNGTL